MSKKGLTPEYRRHNSIAASRILNIARQVLSAMQPCGQSQDSMSTAAMVVKEAACCHAIQQRFLQPDLQPDLVTCCERMGFADWHQSCQSRHSCNCEEEVPMHAIFCDMLLVFQRLHTQQATQPCVTKNGVLAADSHHLCVSEIR